MTKTGRAVWFNTTLQCWGAKQKKNVFDILQTYQYVIVFPSTMQPGHDFVQGQWQPKRCLSTW